MASMEENFPRGAQVKKSSASKTSKHVKKSDVEVDNLFEVREPVVKKKKKKTADADENGKVFKKQKTESSLKLNTVTNVDILHSRNLKVGTVLLGCVKVMTNLEFELGLPNGLRGYLPISNICDSYTKILNEMLNSGSDLEDVVSPAYLLPHGQLVRCVISTLDLSAGGFVSVRVSINPKDVNKGLSSSLLKVGMTLSGCVESVEDYGYLIDTGVSGTKAFLSKDKVKDNTDLKVGQYVTAVVEEVKNDGGLIRLSATPADVNQACAETQHGWTLSNLLPGLLVQACIKKVTPHGLIVTFLSYTGVVDFMHIDSDKASSYNAGDVVKARILYVDPSTRLVGLSMRSHLLPPEDDILANVTSEQVGDVLHGCKMTALHYHSGAIIQLPDGNNAFVHKQQLMNNKKGSNSNQLLSRPAHTVRIMDFSPIEQMFLATMQKKIINAAFFSYKDVKPGMNTECTVQRLEKYGMHVKISNHIKGLIPKMHLADITLSNPEKKYKVDQKIQCRVLSVDVTNKKIIFTRKKALLETTLPLFLSYADARVGLVSHGFIVCIKDFGCIVKFYNDIKGLVPVSELSTEPVTDPQTLFYVGQVVKVKVLKCDLESKKLLLSFKAVTHSKPDITQRANFNIEIGQKVDVKVQSKTLNGLEVSVLPEEVPVLLPTVHLSDHVSNCLLMWEVLQIGDIISNVVCLNKKKGSLIISKKPLLIEAFERGNIVSSFSELQVDTEMVGWVTNIVPYGVFVNFPYGLCGLAPKAAMSDRFIVDVTQAFTIGQTVLAKVINVDKEKCRFLISLKESAVSWEKNQTQTRLIQGLRERTTVCNAIASKSDSDVQQQLASLSLGNKLKVTVKETGEDGSVILTSDNLDGATVLASSYHVTDVDVTPGNNVSAVVLHVDLLLKKLHVSLLPSLTKKKKELKRDSQYLATVLHLDKDFAVVSVGDTGHLTMISLTKIPNDTFSSSANGISVGHELAVTVTDPSSKHLGGLALVEWQFPLSKKSSMSSISDVSKMQKVGNLVTVIVKKIKPTRVLVTLPDGIDGSVHISQICDSPKIGSFPTSLLRVGDEVKARVIGCRKVHHHKFLPITHTNFVNSLPELTLLPSKLEKDLDLSSLVTESKLDNFKPGNEITGYISKYVKAAKCFEIEVSPGVFGSVELLAMITKPQQANHPQKLYKLGQCISAKVVGCDPEKSSILKLSLIGTHVLQKDDVTMGMVQNICPNKGLTLKLPFENSGLVSITDVMDEYTEKPLEQYKVGQVVRCCILKTKLKPFRVSLRLSRIHPGKDMPVPDIEIKSISDLHVGQIIRGYVKNISKLGIFVRLSSFIKGRVLFKNATNYFVSDPQLFSKYISQNALLTTKVVRVDVKAGHVELSLLPEDTGKADIMPESLELPHRLRGKEKESHDKHKASRKRKLSESCQKPSDQKEPKKAKNDSSVIKLRTEKKKEQTEEQDSGVEVYFREEETRPKKETCKAASKEPGRLQVTSEFSWDVALGSLKPASLVQNVYESSDEEQDDQSKSVKKSKRELELERKESELKLSKLEEDLMSPSSRPESAEAFERLLLSSPDSSLLWLQYMAFQLQATQIDQARTVAERALKTISFREEQEKLNVWVALLNLENMYGTEESLQKVFERAIQYCEPMPVYQQLADIYANSNKLKEAESLYKNMLKRFRHEKAVWQSYGSFLLRQGHSDAANLLLQRALQSLSNKEHVDLIVRFARLEFQYGNTERAKAMFDKVLSSYPKRTDLWSVFIDLMMKYGTQKDVRSLFDRVINLSVSVKKVKFFFKRYLEYEKKHGTPESIQAVKNKALEYVESKGTEAAC